MRLNLIASTSALQHAVFDGFSATVVLADWLKAEVLTSEARRTERADQLTC
jgi:hypothetical protein